MSRTVYPDTIEDDVVCGPVLFMVNQVVDDGLWLCASNLESQHAVVIGAIGPHDRSTSNLVEGELRQNILR